ncbi:MAG: peptide chain release factor 2, partial [Planctomycetes bacterium]|nr:peptide chain release factor 2 [Planctomycetota bacterium]
DKALEVIGEIKRLKGEVDPVLELSRTVPDLVELARLADAENDSSSFRELKEYADSAEKRLEELELKSVLSEPHDASSAFLSVHAGAGGTESCDWAEMLARMYIRFAERQGFAVQMIDKVDGEEAGVRNITYQVKGPYAFGYLKGEAGVHRLVRISPFDAKSRRQTSFAAVDVIPEIPETEKDIELNPAELKVDTFRSGGAGGQHVNKVESAVRITHVPTGIVVQCQNERSQHSNRATAMRMLVAKLVRMEEAKREAELGRLYGEKGEISFGYQIRSYVLQPYTMVKDLRTGVETGNANAVLDGELLPFIDGYLRKRLRDTRDGHGAAGSGPVKA